MLDNLGSSLATLIAAPRGVDIPVGEPVIRDPLERSAVDANAIVLVVGVSPDGADAKQAILDAGNARASAAVFKLHGRHCTVVAEAESAGLALLAVPDDVSWTHLHELLMRAARTAIDTSGVSGISSVPMGDLFALANAIAGMAGGAVSIEDKSGRVLAYSNLEGQPIDEVRREVILGRRIPDSHVISAAYRALWDTQGVARVDSLVDLPIAPRIAIAVRAGIEILGSIWVIRGSEPPRAEVEVVLEEASRIAALHIIHARASRDIERRMRGDLLRSMLEGHGSVESAARLGFPTNSVFAVLAFELSVKDRAEEELYRERLVDLVALYCEAFRRKAACVSMGRTVYAVLPTSKPIDRAALMTFAGDILAHAEGMLPVPLKVGVGSTAASLPDLPRVRREADQVLRVLADDPKSRKAAAVEDVMSQVLILELRDLAVANDQLKRGRLQDLFAYDAGHGTAYVPTLRAYLDAFGDVPAGAKLLGVHPNTFRYRLRRLTDMFGLDLADPEERLVIGLQLRMFGTNDESADRS